MYAHIYIAKAKKIILDQLLRQSVSTSRKIANSCVCVYLCIYTERTVLFNYL